MQKKGTYSLPIIFIKGELVMHGQYPERSDWESRVHSANNKNAGDEKLKVLEERKSHLQLVVSLVLAVAKIKA